jgi:uncharacterized protein (TIGR04255 family)
MSVIPVAFNAALHDLGAQSMIQRGMPGHQTRPELPEFSDPPVTEVLLSIQFGSLTKFRSYHIGLLWNDFRRDYPKVTEQAILAPAFETFGVGAPASLFRFETTFQPPMPRFWFESDDEMHLLQLQQDRVVRNWRKRGDAEYPRFEVLRDVFRDEVTKLQRFLDGEDLGQLVPNQCEVAYINTIELPDGANPHTNLHRITPLWGEWTGTLPLENAGLQARSLLTDADAPIGRVYATFIPVFQLEEARPAIQLEITARAKPSGDTIEDAFGLLETQRAVIVRTFDAITTPEMHAIWGKANADS